jgi:8-oxo-dGTP pyrophosphatase MutT (NUDIX family)
LPNNVWDVIIVKNKNYGVNMNEICILDFKDYNPTSPRIIRTAVRGIIFKGDLLALIYSSKDKGYQFPGGGQEANEDDVQTLIREVDEETGLMVISSSIIAYGCIKEIRSSKIEKDHIFEMTSLYYLCRAEEEVGNTSLQDYEREAGYKLVFIKPKDAFHANEECLKNNQSSWLFRENKILKELMKR